MFWCLLKKKTVLLPQTLLENVSTSCQKTSGFIVSNVAGKYSDILSRIFLTTNMAGKCQIFKQIFGSVAPNKGRKKVLLQHWKKPETPSIKHKLNKLFNILHLRRIRVALKGCDVQIWTYTSFAETYQHVILAPGPVVLSPSGKPPTWNKGAVWCPAAASLLTAPARYLLVWFAKPKVQNKSQTVYPVLQGWIRHACSTFIWANKSNPELKMLCFWQFNNQGQASEVLEKILQ